MCLDIGTFPYLRNQLAATAAKHGLEMEWHDLRDVKNRFDDVVAVFRRMSTS